MFELTSYDVKAMVPSQTSKAGQRVCYGCFLMVPLLNDTGVRFR